MSFHPASAQNYSLSFDGSNDYVAVSPIPTFNSTTSVEAWIKIVKPSGYAIAEPNIVSWGNDANSVEFRLGFSGNNATLQFGIDATGSSGGAWQAIYGSTNINIGNWVHVAVVKNGTTSTLYINGVSEVSGTISRSPALNTCTIGNLNEHGSQQNRYFPGLIDEVRIWNTARTQAEIQANMNKELAGTESGLTNYFKMTDGSNSTLTDNKGSSTGTISGATWTQPDAFPVQLFVSDAYAASYATVKGAFDAINAGTHTGAIKLKLAGSTNEIATAALYQSGYAGAGGTSSFSSVTLYPTVTGLSIAGNLAAPLIDLNGADNMTIDGRVNATGAAKDLTITNTSASSTAGTSTVRFINDATTNAVYYCNIKGSTLDASGGILFFSTTTGTTGNNGNTIDHNNITNSADANRPLCAIRSEGTTDKLNSGNTISNNNIYDFFSRSADSYGINIGANSTAWSISGNSFYETADIVPTNNTTFEVIYLNCATGFFTVSNNFIGGKAASSGGEAWTKSAAYGNDFFGIHIVQADPSVVSKIQGNTIGNFNYSNSGGQWKGIYVEKGAVDIGSSVSETGKGNIIGAPSGTGSILYSATGSENPFYGIIISSASDILCNDNIIASITVSNPLNNRTNFFGIDTQNGGIRTISRNQIGSSTPGSISATSNATTSSGSQTVYGIEVGNGSNLTITGNSISNLVNADSYQNTSSYGAVGGIRLTSMSGTNVVSDNTISNLTIATANNFSGGSVYGICNINAWGGSNTITGNTIFNLTNSKSDYAGHVNGVFYYNADFMPVMISNNFIHSLAVTGASSTAATLNGIRVEKGVATLSNNIISLGGNTPTTINGIYETGNASDQTHKLYFNTVYISGIPASGTNSSYGLYSGTSINPRDFRNNIFVNIRSNSAPASGTHYGLFAATGGTFTCNYNDYFVSGTGGKLGYYGSAKTELPIVSGVTGNDAKSKNIDPVFAVSPPGTTATDYPPSATSLIAATGTGITTDYDGGADRSVTYPAMGAFEYNVTPPCANPTSGGTIATAQTICSGFAPADFTSTALPTGHTGTLEYKWQKSTSSASADFADILSSSSATYVPGVLTATTWYKRLSKVTCDAAWPEAGESNVVQITVNPQSFTPAVRHISDLTATGENIKWYAAATGGSPLDITTVVPTGTTHYFASQTVNGVESTARLDVTATVDPTPCKPTAAALQTVDADITVAGLTTTSGQNIRWYLTSSGGTALPSSTVLTSRIYYATQTINCTESATRASVAVTVLPRENR